MTSLRHGVAALLVTQLVGCASSICTTTCSTQRARCIEDGGYVELCQRQWERCDAQCDAMPERDEPPAFDLGLDAGPAGR